MREMPDATTTPAITTDRTMPHARSAIRTLS